MLAALLALPVIFILWRIGSSGQENGASWVDSLLAIAPDLLLVGFLWHVIRQPGLDADSRRVWTWVTMAAATIVAGDVIWAVHSLVLGVPAFPSLADVAYLAFVPCMLLGLVAYPVTSRRPAGKLTFWLDTGVVLVVIWMTIWYFVLAPTFQNREETVLATITAATYVAGDLMLLYAAARVLLRRPVNGLGLPLMFLLLGIGALVLGDVGYAALDMGNNNFTGHWVDLLWVLAPVLWGLSAYTHLRWSRRDVPRPDAECAYYDYPAGNNMISYAAIGLGCVLLVAGYVLGDGIQFAGLLVGAPIVAGLLVARQVLATAEIRRLLERSMALSKRLRESEARFRSLVQHGSDIMLVLDKDARIRYISPSLERVTGVPPEQVQNQPLMERIHPDDRETVAAFLRAAAAKPGFSGTVEVRIRHTDGSCIHVEAVASNQLDNPNVRGIVVNARDITDRKQLEASLVWQANHDVLSGLPNRKLFLDELEQALALEIGSQQMVGVLFLDLDGFKQVNDSLGHTTGDHLLVAVAERLKEYVTDGVMAARLGGDEFTVLLTSVTGYHEICDVARDIQERLDAPYVVEGHVIEISPSIGIALGTPGVDRADDVLRRADGTMYRAKAQRKSGVAVDPPPESGGDDASLLHIHPSAGRRSIPPDRIVS